MNIGQIIQLIRENASMSRDELASGICSSKFIYLIEKGERCPSVNMMNNLSERLKTDLFEMIPYMECIEPILVKNCVEEFELYRNSLECKRLRQITNKAAEHKDFQDFPWNTEILYNEYFCDLFENKDINGIRNRILETIREFGGETIIELLVKNDITHDLIKFYSMVAITFFIQQDYEKGGLFMEYVYNSMNSFKNLKKYCNSYISTSLNQIHYLLLSAQYERALIAGQTLLEYQTRNNKLDRVYHTFFMLSECYEKLKNQNAAIEMYKKFLFVGMAITKQEIIETIMEEEFAKRMNKAILESELASMSIGTYLDQLHNKK